MPLYSFSGFRYEPTLRTLLRGGTFVSAGCRAWLGLTTMTDLLEFCFWFLRPPSLGWLLMIQLLCTMRLYRPSSLANSPRRPFFYFSFFGSSFFGYSLALRRRAALESLLTSGGLMASWEWVCALRMEILSWRRSFIRCSFLR